MHETLKKMILGDNYSLSLAYLTPRKSREINRKYRKVDKPTNVLAFPLSQNEGEILLCRSVIRDEAKRQEIKYRDWERSLVIHGMLHLIGYEHGSIMDKRELYYASKLKSRNRPGQRKHAHRRRGNRQGR